jgi:hypothetical protein
MKHFMNAKFHLLYTKLYYRQLLVKDRTDSFYSRHFG